MAYRIEQTGAELQGILNGAVLTKQGLEDEVARAQAAEDGLQENIDSEAGERQGADALLAGNIGTEVARAQQAEGDLGVRIDANTAGVAAEVARAQEAEGQVWDTLNDEILTRQSQDAALQGNIEREAGLREAGDGQLQGEIDAINGKIPAEASEMNQLADKQYVQEAMSDVPTREEVDDMIDTLSRNEVIVGALPQTGEEGVIYRVPGNGYYTDYMYYDGEFVELSQYSMEFDQTQVGYFTCDTAAGTAAKTVSAAGYTLAVGGNMRIKMTNANTAANATLNINGAGAKTLFYNGEQASSTNSWDAGEVLTVYYDGTQYQCASGGGAADKIKYDNSTSQLQADDVQGGVDEIVERIKQDETSEDPIQIPTSSHPVTLSDAYSTNNVLWNGTVNVGQTFSEGIVENQNNNVIYKIAVTAGQVVKFNVRPSGYGNYGKVLLTDANMVVKAKVDRGAISEGTTIAVEYDGWLYTNSTNSVNNPLDIQDVVTYLSNKKLTEMAGKADADNVSYDNTISGLFSGDVQNAVSEIVNSEIAFDYTFAKTGRFNLDGTINANSDYRITSPLLLKAGVTLKVTTYINSQYGYIATTDESGSSYTVVAANRSADGEVSGSYTAETDVWVAFSLKINYDASVARLQYPKAITGEKVAYDASDTPIITGDNMQQAVEDMYNMVAGAFTVEYSNAGNGFVDMRTHEISDSGYFRYTNPLQLSRGDEIIVTTNLVGYIAIISLTDAQGSYYTPVVSDSGTWETIRTFTYTASSDCYVVISHAVSQTTYQIKYMKRFLSDSLESYDSQLKKSGGDFLVLGDSATADVNGWTKDVANTYGLPLTNIAVGGAVWCSYAPFRVDLSGDYTEDHGLNNIENQVYRFLQMITPVGEIVPELTEDMVYNTGYSYPVLGTGLMDRDNVRLIGISCGGNDNNLSYQDGDLDVVCSGDVRDVDRSTMRGIIRWACVILQYYCPNAKIFLLTAIPAGRSLSSYALERVGNNIKTVAYRTGVNVVDMQYCGISSAVAGMTIIPDTNNASRYFRDGLHPNNFGQRLMGGYVTSVLDTWWKY